MRLLRPVIVLAIVLGASETALAVGEVVTDIKVQNNIRTQEDAVRSMAGLSIGDVLEANTLETVRERLYTSGLFADVNVFWEPHKEGVRVNIVIKDKFPWAPLPTFSLAPGNKSAGVVVVHGNLFGRGKRGLIGGRISNADSGAVAAYEDPALFGSWLFFNLKGKFQDQVIPEYGNTRPVGSLALRETTFRSWGFEANAGVAWFRRVKTSVGWNIENYSFLGSKTLDPTIPNLGPAAEGATRGLAQMNLTFDFRAREHAIMHGNALAFGLDIGSPRWGGDSKINYWKAGASYEHGIRILRRHNFIFRAEAIAAQDPPMWSENSAGGTNLRGFVYKQFMGDTHLRTQAEYHFPLFSIYQLDLRGLLFSDTAAIWYRSLAPQSITGRHDGRLFLPSEYLKEGFDITRDVHASAGAGLRFFLRSVAVPLVGIDYGHGFGTEGWKLILVLGA